MTLPDPRRALRRGARWGLHRAEQWALRQAHPLRYLFLELTRRCNLACVYCGSDCAPRARGAVDELDRDAWLAIVRQVARDFRPADVMVALTGGEPLLKEGALDLAAELGRLGFPFGLVTNGHLLDRQAAEALVGAGLRSISLSLDGPPEANDALRGAGTAAAVEAAIAHLRAAGYRGILEILTTVTAPAARHLEETRRFVAGLRVPRWRLVVAMPIGRAARRPELVPDPGDLRATLELVRRGRADGRWPRPEFCEEGYLGDEYEGEVRPYLCQCRAGVTVAGIRADGRIGACPELGDAFTQGDIRRERLRDVWETRYRPFRDRAWARRGACADCPNWGRCQGGSLHLYDAPGAELQRCLRRMLAR